MSKRPPIHEEILRAQITRHGVEGVLDLDSIHLLQCHLRGGDTLELIRKGDLNSPFRPAPWNAHDYGIQHIHGPAMDLHCAVQYHTGEVCNFKLPLILPEKP